MTDRTIRITRALALTLLGLLAFPGSLAHLIHAADALGQHGVIGILIAASVDVLAVGATAELIDRSRNGLRRWDAMLVLMIAVVVTVAGQLVTAQQTFGGYVAAVWPAVAFLADVLLVEARPRKDHGSDRRTEAAWFLDPDGGTHLVQVPAERLHSVPAAKAEPVRRVHGQVATAVLDALADSAMTLPQLVTATGRARTSIMYQLERLQERGVIACDGDGVYSRLAA